MPGGIHPPLEVMLAWPRPNESNPEKRSNAIVLLSYIGGPLTVLLLLVRLWVRIFHQRHPGWDDWIMLVAMVPTTALMVLFPLASSYGFNRHVWDYNPLKNPKTMVTARKYVLTIECIFCISSGLIKVSILLFYRRLSSRSVSKTFRWVTWITIGFIIAYTIALTIAPIVGCQPISAFWDQVDIAKLLRGYEYHCFDEGADVFAASVISVVQDFVTALLPTFLYWDLQIPLRQKVALFGIFAIGYGVVALGGLRAYFSYKIFYLTYDVTWYTWDLMLVTILELQIGCFCANAPALKVFFKHFFHETVSSFSRSRSGPGSIGQKSSDRSKSTSSSKVISKIGSLLHSKNKSGYISEPHTHVSVDIHGGVQVQKEFHVTRSSSHTVKNRYRSGSTTDTIYNLRYEDIELAERIHEGNPRRHTATTNDGDREELELNTLPQMPTSPRRAKSPRSPVISRSSSILHAIPWTPKEDRIAKEQHAHQAAQTSNGPKPEWQTWS